MKKELGIARCGLACCLCSENEHCGGCQSDSCMDKDWCENRKCSLAKNLAGCYACDDANCRKGMLSKIKPLGITEFARQYGVERLMACLERNENQGVVYHRSGIFGDYDDFDSVEELLELINNGRG